MRATRPGYWMNETSGRLRAAVEAYLYGGQVKYHHIAALRAYFRHWMDLGDFRGDAIPALTAQIEGIGTRGDVQRWLDAAAEQGIDPL